MVTLTAITTFVATGERFKYGHAGRGARVRHFVRIRDGVRRPSSTLCHWLGGTRAVEGEGPVSQQNSREDLSRTCPVPGRESTVLSRKVTRASACPVGSTYREERRTCCDNDAHLSHQLVPHLAPCCGGRGSTLSLLSLNRQSAPLRRISWHYGPTDLSASGSLEYSTATQICNCASTRPRRTISIHWVGNRRAGGPQQCTRCMPMFRPAARRAHQRSTQALSLRAPGKGLVSISWPRSFGITTS